MDEKEEIPCGSGVKVTLQATSEISIGFFGQTTAIGLAYAKVISEINSQFVALTKKYTCEPTDKCPKCLLCICPLGEIRYKSQQSKSSVSVQGKWRIKLHCHCES